MKANEGNGIRSLVTPTLWSEVGLQNVGKQKHPLRRILSTIELLR